MSLLRVSEWRAEHRLDWVTNSDSDNVTKLRASDGAVLGNFKVGKALGGVAFDGKDIWVTNEDSNNVMRLRASDGMVLETFTVGTLSLQVTSDGANIWVTNGRSDSVTKLKITK